MTTTARLKVQQRISLGILLAGIALVTYMVTMEGELGALPLFLILLGTAGVCISRYRLGRARQ